MSKELRIHLRHSIAFYAQNANVKLHEVVYRDITQVS